MADPDLPRLRRRPLLTCVLLGAASMATRPARAFSEREMTAPEARRYANRCASDFAHAADIDTAIGRLRAAGVVFDEAALRSSQTCPLCGCKLVGLGPGQPG